MHERYGCDGTQQLNRTAAYFEYPSTVAILLREIRYGIELAFDHVTVDPMPKTAFSYHIGNVNIDCEDACCRRSCDMPAAAHTHTHSTHPLTVRAVRAEYGVSLYLLLVIFVPPGASLRSRLRSLLLNNADKPNATSFLKVPSFGGRSREYRLAGMQTDRRYAIRAAANCAQAHGHAALAAVDTVVAADPSGVLRFHAAAPCGVSIEVK